MDQKKIDLLKKLKTLAEQGIGGEKETAQKKLEQLMQKYNVEEQDFLFECFIQKHRIFTSNDEEKNGEGKKLTMAEKIRMNAAMKAMQDKSMTQRIEG